MLPVVVFIVKYKYWTYRHKERQTDASLLSKGDITRWQDTQSKIYMANCRHQQEIYGCIFLNIWCSLDFSLLNC